MARQTVEIEFIETEAAYRRALKRLAMFFDAPPKAGTRDDTEFRLLMLMVERYESEVPAEALIRDYQLDHPKR